MPVVHIAYFGQGFPGDATTPEFFRNRSAVRAAFSAFARATGTDNHGQANATVYACADDAMRAQALDFSGIGCPFDYPSYLLEYDERGKLTCTGT